MHKKKKYLFGLIRYESWGEWNFIVRFLGMRIYQRWIKDSQFVTKILWHKNILSTKRRINKIHRNIKNEFKNIKEVFILFNNTGETFLYLNAMANEFKKRSDIAIVYTRNYHIQLLEHILGKGKYLFEKDLNSAHVNKDCNKEYIIDEVKYHMIAPATYFIKYENSIHQENNIKNIKHFYMNFIDNFAEGRSFKSYPIIGEDVIDSANRKIKFLNIPSKFLLICNETWSNENFSDTFYQQLCFNLNNKGLHVVFNSTFLSNANSYGTSSFFSIKEIIYIASKAISVIGIRSGILDIITPYSKNVIALYTDFRNRGKDLPSLNAEKVLQAFTLKKLPNTSHIKISEIVVDEKSRISLTMPDGEKLIDKILKNI